MTSLENAISHCIKVAEKNEKTAKMIENNFGQLRREQRQEVNSCRECAAEHRQLAEWLKVLKEIWDSGDCNDCMFKGMCAIEPKLGQMVRYNCYGYAKREVNADAEGSESE